jgi:hypothetical protein
MPFTFKLSKRLALLKASLAASTAPVLACDRTDPTLPQALSSSTLSHLFTPRELHAGVRETCNAHYNNMLRE